MQVELCQNWCLSRPFSSRGTRHIARDTRSICVTLHHKMSRNVPDGHFHVFISSESKFYAIYNGETIFKSEG